MGSRSSIPRHPFHLPYSGGPPRVRAGLLRGRALAACQDFSSHPSYHLHTAYIYTHTSNLLFARQRSIRTGEPSSSSFPPPRYSHTRIHCPAAPPISPFSSSLLLCVFCFGAVIFRLISEVMHFLQIKEEAGAAHLPPPAPRAILLPPPPTPLLYFPPPHHHRRPPAPVSRSRPSRPSRPERR